MGHVSDDRASRHTGRLSYVTAFILTACQEIDATLVALIKI